MDKKCGARAGGAGYLRERTGFAEEIPLR
jgi:hypothetical protein